MTVELEKGVPDYPNLERLNLNLRHLVREILSNEDMAGTRPCKVLEQAETILGIDHQYLRVVNELQANVIKPSSTPFLDKMIASKKQKLQWTLGAWISQCATLSLVAIPSISRALKLRRTGNGYHSTEPLRSSTLNRLQTRESRRLFKMWFKHSPDTAF